MGKCRMEMTRFRKKVRHFSDFMLFVSSKTASGALLVHFNVELSEASSELNLILSGKLWTSHCNHLNWFLSQVLKDTLHFKIL